MLISPKSISKVRRMVDTYSPLIFEAVNEVPVHYFETREHLRSVPAGWQKWPCAAHRMGWGEQWGSCWFVGKITVPQEAAGEPLFIRAQTGGYEALFWVNGEPRGIFTHPKDAAPRGNHHTLSLERCGVAGREYEIAAESYAGHPATGSMPFDTPQTQDAYPIRFPKLFEGIKERVKEGRWEPNGGAWIECDCNMTSGESMVRQFMKGQRYTQTHFGYRSNVFWLPDTFGYSAALPQILLGCGIRNFLTTKLTWNDTNTFPLDTFYWEGIDGSKVLTHFNNIHCWPDPATLITKLHGGQKDFRTVENYVQHKEINDRRLISYGFGDGGGGPQFEMLEMARRCRDLDGCPRAEHTTVRQFMDGLEVSSNNIPTYSGELYFEGHRGTFTQMGAIKRGVRKSEIALHNAEFLSSVALLSGGDSRKAETDALYDLLLINQFHDILPGTSMPEVHDRAITELQEVEQTASRLAQELGSTHGDSSAWTLWNSLSWEREGTFRIEGLPPGTTCAAPSVTTQPVEPIGGKPALLVKGLHVPALGRASFPTAPAAATREPSPFSYRDRSLVTPLFRVEFDEYGYIASLYDLPHRRELRGRGLPLNAFLLGEDVPEVWDNWDIDPDQKIKMKLQTRLIERRVVADGPLCFTLRSVYEIGRGSRITQDMAFYTDSYRIDFDTHVDWHEKHQLLKVGFDLNLRFPYARHEIQFGHALRPAVKNNSYEKAMFEVCNHKWTDFSETLYGVALLNDSKYGISVENSDLRLTLLKGGCHPDPRGDAGEHLFSYALLPHTQGFSTATVVRPAYEFNTPLIVSPGALPFEGICDISAPNILCETVKPAEDGQGIILRLYETEGAHCQTEVTLRQAFREIVATNLLEENPRPIPMREGHITLDFSPFQIITLKALPYGRTTART
ncbi:MAG: alpha-mannosidase [Chthoniobacteraceae bacterium]